jgi:hypothetical protein
MLYQSRSVPENERTFLAVIGVQVFMGMLNTKLKQIKGEVSNYWIVSANEFSVPPLEFYEALEQELAALKIPGLEISRQEYAEGGLLSAKRIYLRIMRERHVFLVCATPFGTRYFFSCRAIHSPATLKLWHALVVSLFFTAFFGLERLLGRGFAIIALFGVILAAGLMFRNALVTGLADIDTALLKTPIAGPIYEQFFRKDTYYRQDTRRMYLDTIPAVIQGLVDEITGAKGVKLIRKHQPVPILEELYRPSPPRTGRRQK